MLTDKGRIEINENHRGAINDALIRWSPNGETHPMLHRIGCYEILLLFAMIISSNRGTRGTETSKYPEEKKSQRVRQ